MILGLKWGLSSDLSSDSGTAALRPLRMWHQSNLSNDSFGSVSNMLRFTVIVHKSSNQTKWGMLQISRHI